MKSIKKIFYGLGKALKLFWHVFVWLVLIAFFVYCFFDDDGSCMDTGGVWDPHEKRCRYDCLKWTEDDGCIPL